MARIKSAFAKNKLFATLSLGGLFALALVFATSAIARPFMGERSPEKMQKHLSYMVNDVLDDLDASDNQRSEVNTIVNDAFTDLAPMMKNKKQTKEAVLAELKKENPDRRAIDSILGGAESDMKVAKERVVDAVLDIHTVLDAKQRAQLAEKFEERRGHRRGWFGH